MKDAEEFLSEIYFYELETRDKIFNRLQLNFAIYTTVIAMLAYMARMIDYNSNCTILTLFYVGLVFGISLISISIYYSCISLSLSDLKYMLFPRATDIIDYRSKLDIRWKEIEKYNDDLIVQSDNNNDLMYQDEINRLDNMLLKLQGA